jgi:hypothetical protein
MRRRKHRELEVGADSDVESQDEDASLLTGKSTTLDALANAAKEKPSTKSAVILAVTIGVAALFVLTSGKGRFSERKVMFSLAGWNS